MGDDMLAHYSAALDEIYELRAAMAHEADVLARHLELATFPKSRREAAEQQVDRMNAAARGSARITYRTTGTEAKQEALRSIGASPTLTRGQWEAER